MIELTKGQELALTTDDGQPLARLQLGVGWDKEPTAGFIGTGAPEIDLDASAVQFASGQLFDLAFYNNLKTRDGSVVHLGDNTTGRGEGDDEVLTVDLGQGLREGRHHRPVREQLPGPHPRVDRQRLLPARRRERRASWLASGSPGECRETGLVMAKLFRDGEQWRLRAIGEGIAVKVPTESVEALRPYV